MSGSVIPFRQFVLKVSSRCDLACDHCYVYEHADQGWRAQPKLISAQTVTAVAERIAEHARSHALPGVRVILHGGEPLLAGRDQIRWICGELRRVIEAACRLDLRTHTNGVLLDEDFCALFAEQRVRVGVSLDGDRAGNDRHRTYANGRSSYDQVIAAIELLRRHRALYAGLLCTIDVRNDPVATYDALAALDPPDIDFLLPHATWDHPPPGAAAGATPYADWLSTVFDRWVADRRRVPVRLFESVIATTNGGASRTEALGLAATDIVVIETDGSIEQADSLKVAYDGAAQTGFDVLTHSLDEAARHAAITARQQGLAGLCATCRECPVVTSCGGGLYAHRYRAGSGFDNPSVFCGDLVKVITHVRESLPAADGGRIADGSRAVGRRRKVHALPAAQFDALASGYGDRDAIGYLIESQRSVSRALLARVRASSADGPSWEVLTSLDAAGTLDEVLAHPYVRAWASRGADAARGDDGGHLAAIAAAAAIRAGLPAELTVPARDGYLSLPTLGRMRADAAVRLTTGSDWFAVRTPGGELTVKMSQRSDDWEPVRALHAEGITVALEDTDPYRDCHQWAAASRLDTDEAATWQLRFRQAWEFINREFPAYAPGLATGLTTITPLANDASGREISAAARQAFGAVGAALPDTADTLALLLMHEFQHVKLGAILDMFDLCDRDGHRVFYAPWRHDPRPAEALLQGTYAHIAVTDFWRLRRHQLTGAEAETAAARFALWRAQTASAAETLACSGALTPLGSRFVDGMRATLAPWLDEGVTHCAASLARRWAEEHRAAWAHARDEAAI
jgi:uncharacterized protein